MNTVYPQPEGAVKIPKKPYGWPSMDADGNMGFRTQLVTKAQAHSLAPGIETRPHILRATPCFQPLALAPRNWFIFLIPSSLERQQDVFDWMQCQREYRALTEGEFYRFDKDERFPHLWRCASTSGETYEMDDRGGRFACECWDWRRRGRKASLEGRPFACKHAIAAYYHGHFEQPNIAPYLVFCRMSEEGRRAA